MTTSEEDKVLRVVTDTHDICSVGLFWDCFFRIDLRPILVSGNTHNVVAGVFFGLFRAVITPDTDTPIPTDSNELSVLVFFHSGFTRLEDTTESRYLSVNFLTPFNGAAESLFSLNRFQALSVREIPNLTVTAFSCRDESSGSRVEASSSNLRLMARSSLVFRHLLTSFDIPDSNETALISTNDRLELSIK
jgi:hypothetical protein